VIDVLSSYQMERHIQRERDERRNVLRKKWLPAPTFKSFGTASNREPRTG
jgi:hypothetical protein